MKKYQCKSYHNYGHFTRLCYKKQVPFKSRAAKAHQIQAEEVYMQDESICGQSEDFTSSDDSFCHSHKPSKYKVSAITAMPSLTKKKQV